MGRVKTSTEADDEIRALNDGAFDEAGVDLTQIDMMLAMTPRERLDALYASAKSLARLMRNAGTDELEYDDAVSDCVELDVDGITVRVLSLERLITVKENAGREKDLAVLPLLKATLTRRRDGK